MKGSARNSNVCLIGILQGETNNKEEKGILRKKEDREKFWEVKKDKFSSKSYKS